MKNKPKHLRILLIFAILILIVNSCTENIVNNYYYSKIGSISGLVTISHDYGIYFTDNRGVNVWIPGTNFKTVTDSIGLWHLDSVPMGIYDIYFNKSGCDTTKRFGFQYIGEGNVNFGGTAVYEIPSENVQIDSVTTQISSDSTYISCYFHAKLDKQSVYVTFYIDSTANVSKINNINYSPIYTNKILTINNSMSLSLVNANYKIVVGKKYYACAYAGTQQKIIDYRTGKFDVIGLGKQSNIVSFVMTK